MYTVARRLAGLWRDNLWVEYNVEAAKNLFERCIDEQNHVGAMFDLATLLENRFLSGGSDLRRCAALYERCVVESNSNKAKLSLACILLPKTWRMNIPDPRAFVRAIQLYESCIEETGDKRAMYHLAKILVEGAPGVHVDMTRALQLYERCIDNSLYSSEALRGVINIIMSGADGVEDTVVHALQIVKTFLHANLESILNIVRIKAFRRMRILRLLTNPMSTIRLLEMCVEETNDISAIAILAEMLLFQAPPDEKYINRGLQLLAKVLELEENRPTPRLPNIADEIVINERQWWTAETTVMVIRLCEMYVEKKDNLNSRLILAEIFMTGAPGVEKDLDRAMKLCAETLDRNGSPLLLTELAENIILGRLGINADVQLAVQLCDLCVKKKGYCRAMIILIEIFLCGFPGIERDIDRARDLYGEYWNVIISQPEFCPSPIYFARRLSFGRFRIDADVLLVMQLCEMCIERRNNSGAMLLLADLFMTEGSGVKDRMNRVMVACETYLYISGTSVGLANLAKKIAEGTSGIVRDVELGIQLCELCINRKNDGAAMVTLAEILMTGAPGVEIDVDRGMELCSQYLSQARYTNLVSALAQRMTQMRCGKRKDVKLAVRLCEMCINKKNDADATMVLLEILINEDMGGWKNVYLLTKLWENSLCAHIEYDRVASAVRDMAFGRGHTKRTIFLAVEILKFFIARTNDPRAMVALGEIAMDCEMETEDCGVQLIEMALDKSGGDGEICCHVIAIAKRIMCGNYEIAKSEQLAFRLCEMCITKCDEARIHPDSLVNMAEVLLAGASASTDVDRAIHFCEVAARNRDVHYKNVVDLARYIAFGLKGMRKDTALGVRLCKIWITKTANAHAFIALAEIFIAGTSQLEKDVNYAIELCEESVTENRYENLVACLAMRVASGTEWMKSDAAVAAELCTRCIAKWRDLHIMVVLSEIYSVGGRGVQIDMHRAHELYQKAVDEGWLMKGGRSHGKYLHVLPVAY